MIKRQPSEKGQVLVLIVLALVVLLGFTALAVDGGMVYSDRRHAQNTGDAASLAGGSAAALTLENSSVTYGNWDCSNSAIGDARDDAEAAAIDRAGDNGFAIDDNVADHHGVTTACGEENHGAWTEKFIDVTTEISTTTRTSFAHFVYPGKLQSRIKAVTRIRPRASLGFGNSIVALNEEQSCHGGTPNGVVFEGNVDVQVTGGGIFSNGCIQASGNSFDVGVECTDDTPDEGCIVHVGDLETNHVENFDPEPDSGDGLLLPDFALLYPNLENCNDSSLEHDPDSPGNEYRTHVGGTFADPDEIVPGNYSEIQLTGSVVMRPGLYCLYGDFDVGNNDLQGEDVTIFMISGSFNVNGGGVVNIHAPTGDPDTLAPAIPGMLIYMADCSQTTFQYCPAGENEGTIKLRGNTDSTFEGTIFAPLGRIDIAGTPDMPEDSDAVFNTQLIAKDVEIGGNSIVDVNFDEETNYIMPTNLELHR